MNTLLIVAVVLLAIFAVLTSVIIYDLSGFLNDLLKAIFGSFSKW
jgi:hypothetical protein